MAAPDRDNDLEALIDAVKAGGDVAMRFFGQDNKVWEKAPGDPVSEADLAVNAELKTRLTARRPDYGWLSEECAQSDDHLRKNRIWVVDPIDGTRAFIKGRPHFTICAALLEAGQPIAAAVYNPAADELYEAADGRGARLNGVRISASDREALEGCRMLGAMDMFSHPDWPEPWPEMHIEQRNSIAYRMVLVASGAFDGAIALKAKHEWDTAAGALIAREAGAHVSDHLGRPLAFAQSPPLQPSLICAASALAPKLLERVAFLTDL
ncbi:MAG: 3'(2'),5'-bisphosphate nucleotidase CysQ [Pseudomonadota bacterium]